MKIAATQYTLQYNSLDIYLAGCKGDNGIHCKGCHNPELWDFNIGEEYNEQQFNNIKQKVEKFNNMIDNIMIFGGEPLDNSIYEMVKFLSDLKTLNKKIWLFTRYELDNIKTTIICLCDYIKTGAYIEDKLVDNHEMFGIKLASSNQQIYKF